jgi:hypothetical protein
MKIKYPKIKELTPAKKRKLQKEQDHLHSMDKAVDRAAKRANKRENDYQAERKTKKKAILHPKRVVNEAKYVGKRIGKGLKKLFISND